MEKIVIFFDWLWKLFLLNVLTLVCSLGIVTILPSFSACINTINDIKEGNCKNIYKSFFLNFKALFKKSIFVGITMLIIISLFGYALFYYRVIIGAEEFKLDTLGIIAYIGYYFSFFILVVLMIIANQMPMIFNYFNFRFRDNFKFSLIVSFRFLFKSILVLLSWGISIAMIIIPKLLPVWFFLGLSIPLFFTYLIMNPIYNYLVNNKADVTIEREEK